MLETIIEGFAGQIDITNYIDIRIVLLLLAVGFLVKHFIPQCDNKFIPAILLAVSMIYAYTTIVGFTLADVTQAIVTAIIASSVAIGIHTNAKSLFLAVKKTILKSISDSIENIADDAVEKTKELASKNDENEDEIDE